jgi:hypothetical protein
MPCRVVCSTIAARGCDGMVTYVTDRRNAWSVTRHPAGAPPCVRPRSAAALPPLILVAPLSPPTDHPRLRQRPRHPSTLYSREVTVAAPPQQPKTLTLNPLLSPPLIHHPVRRQGPRHCLTPPVLPSASATTSHCHHYPRYPVALAAPSPPPLGQASTLEGFLLCNMLSI